MQKQNKMPGFHLYKGSSKHVFYWNFRSKNGRIIAKSSEDYNSKQGAIKNIQVIIKLLDATDLCLYYDHTKCRSLLDTPDLFVFK